MTNNIYSNLKLIDYVSHMKSFKERKLLAPVHVRIKPTNICNHNCSFCAYRVNQLDLGNEMNIQDSISSEKMNEICNDLIKMNVKAVTFSGGGEPLIYKDIEKTVSHLGRAGIKIGLLTNGSFLESAKADAFARYGSWVRISMDYWNNESCRESRETNGGEFTRVSRNIKAFIERRSSCILGVSYIVTHRNYDKVYELCTHMKSLGVDHVKISACVVSMDGRENNDYHEPFRDEVIAQIRAASLLNDSSFKVVNHYHRAQESFEKKYTTCPFSQILTIIGADSHIYSCQDKAYTSQGRLGSIKNTSFIEFWFSKENQRKILALNPKINCNHHCVSNSKNQLIHEYLNLDEDHKYFV